MAFTFIAGFSAVFGAAEGIRAAQAKSRREEHRTRKQNLIVHVPKSSEHSRVLEGRSVVLSGNKVYIDTGMVHEATFGHPFAGYFLPYPDAPYSGLVSEITPKAPVMNWVYVDRDTLAVKFGNRDMAEYHHTGPWDCTRQDKRLTFGGWEGFVAVQEGPFWAIYFDREDDRLKHRVAEGTPVIGVELVRVEMRAEKPQALSSPLAETFKTDKSPPSSPQGQRGSVTTGIPPSSPHSLKASKSEPTSTRQGTKERRSKSVTRSTSAPASPQGSKARSRYRRTSDARCEACQVKKVDDVNWATAMSVKSSESSAAKAKRREQCGGQETPRKAFVSDESDEAEVVAAPSSTKVGANWSEKME